MDLTYSEKQRNRKSHVLVVQPDGSDSNEIEDAIGKTISEAHNNRWDFVLEFEDGSKLTLHKGDLDREIGPYHEEL